MPAPKKKCASASRNATGLKKVLRAVGFKEATKDPRQVENGKKTLAPYVDKTKPYRFVKGDPRLTGPKKIVGGTRKMLIAPGAIPGAKKRISELLKELQDQPVAKELAKMLGVPEDSTLGFAVALALYHQALSGDVNAIKLLQFNTEGIMDQPAPVAAPTVVFEVIGVKPETVRQQVNERGQKLLPEPEPEPSKPEPKIITPFSITEDKQ